MLSSIFMRARTHTHPLLQTPIIKEKYTFSTFAYQINHCTIFMFCYGVAMVSFPFLVVMLSSNHGFYSALALFFFSCISLPFSPPRSLSLPTCLSCSLSPLSLYLSPLFTSPSLTLVLFPALTPLWLSLSPLPSCSHFPIPTASLSPSKFTPGW